MMIRSMFIFLAIVAAFVLVYGDENRLIGTKSRQGKYWHKHHVHMHGLKRSSMHKNQVLFIKERSHQGNYIICMLLI